MKLAGGVAARDSRRPAFVGKRIGLERILATAVAIDPRLLVLTLPATRRLRRNLRWLFPCPSAPERFLHASYNRVTPI